MDVTNQRSRLLLDIEHDLSLIKNRLNKLEDHFDDDGVIGLIAESLHKVAVELERIKTQRSHDAAE